MGKTKNATTRTIKENIDGPINQVTIDANVKNDRIPAAAQELEKILESYFNGSGYPLTISGQDTKKAVHSISVYNDGRFFAVSMYARAISMKSINEIEKIHGYKLDRVNMQSAALFFWRIEK